MLVEELISGDGLENDVWVDGITNCEGYVAVWYTDGTDERFPHGTEIAVPYPAYRFDA